MKRQARFAGSFYPANAKELEKVVEAKLVHNDQPRSVLGIIVPHAGYVYSGGVAGHVFGAIKVPSRCIVLSPNHTGLGCTTAIYPGEAWQTPLGTIPVDMAFCRQLIDRLPTAEADPLAHLEEHSIEVELPFIKHCNPEAKIVPITLGSLGVEQQQRLGETLAELIQTNTGDSLIVASSDMNHFESAKISKAKDEQAIACVLELDPKKLFETVRARDISMCGVIPSATMLYAAKKLGAKQADLLAYANSGEVSGDFDSVVGYAGLIIS